MSTKQMTEIPSKSKLSLPLHLMTDVGGYCYMSLTSVALNMLFREGDEENAWNKQFVEKAVKSLADHLKQPDRVAETALVIANSVEIQHYQPFIESLQKEELVVKEGLSVLPKDLVIVGLQEGCYDARLRTLAKLLCLLLKVDWLEIEAFEDLVLRSFQEEEHVETEEEKKEKASKERLRKIKKVALIGAATVGGGVLVGLTGGLAAPLIAAGAGAVIGGAGAAALGSTAGIAIIGSLFGVAGAGLGGYKMKKRVGDVEEFTFEPLTEGSQLHVTIAITGWITEECPDFAFAWRGLANSEEQFILRYESKYLKQMGSAMDYLLSFAVSQATSEALKYTVLSSLMAAIVWPATILAASSVIDNPWSMMTSRTVQAGKMLADVLLSRQQGKRPVTLIGFSLGARVIFYCLQEMSKRKNSEGIIEDAVMLGTPVTANASHWKALSRVVAGKVVNGYCRGDWLLKFLYRTASVQFSIAGLEPIKWKDRRMHNIDLSEVVEGHMDYMNKLDQILDIVGIKTKPHATGGSKHNLKEWVAVNKVKTGIVPGSTPTGAGGLKGVAETAEEATEVATDSVEHPDVLEEALKANERASGNSANSLCSSGLTDSSESNETAKENSEHSVNHSEVLEEALKKVNKVNPGSFSSSTSACGKEAMANVRDHPDVQEEALRVNQVRIASGPSHVSSSEVREVVNNKIKENSREKEGIEEVARTIVMNTIMEAKEKITREGTSIDMTRDHQSPVKKDIDEERDGKSGVHVDKKKASLCEGFKEDIQSSSEEFIATSGTVTTDSVQNTESFTTGATVSHGSQSFREAGGLLEVSPAGHMASSFPSTDSGFDSFATQEDMSSPEKFVD